MCNNYINSCPEFFQRRNRSSERSRQKSTVRSENKIMFPTSEPKLNAKCSPANSARTKCIVKPCGQPFISLPTLWNLLGKTSSDLYSTSRLRKLANASTCLQAVSLDQIQYVTTIPVESKIVLATQH